MVHLLGRALASLAHEADGCGEDAFATLAGLHGARGKGAAVAHALDEVHDGDRRRAREQEVAVARVRQEIFGDRLLRRGEALGDDGAAKDASRAGRKPCGSRVGEDVLHIRNEKSGYCKLETEIAENKTYRPKDPQLRHLERILNRRLILVALWRPQQRRPRF